MPVEFDPSLSLVLTDEFSRRRYIVLVGGEQRTFPLAAFEMLCELVWARHFGVGGYLHRDDCDTTRPNPDYFCKLADRVRFFLGGDSFLSTGPKRYRLPFLRENIALCPGVFEIPELNPAVVKKLQLVVG